MSTATPIQTEPLRETSGAPRPYKFTVDEFEMMGTAGIFGEDDRVELIEGEILQMSPIGTHHMSVVNRLNMIFAQAVGKSAIVSVQNPIVVNRYNEPEPDLVILKYRDDFYKDTRPRIDDIIVLIEVADTTAHYDRTRKKSIYAKNGVREFWLVDVRQGQVEQYTNPGTDDYRDLTILKDDVKISPKALPELQFEVLEILGPK